MPQFSTTRLVPYSSQQMFDLVADIEQYPEFLPLCKDLNIIKTYEQDGHKILLANMEVGYKFINESFCTEVTLKHEEKRIEVKYIDGPFSYLENSWSFYPVEQAKGCRVEFFIEYEFKSRMLGMLMGEVFERAFTKFAGAFEDRAKDLYNS